MVRIAAIDLGSNSFRVQHAHVEPGGEIVLDGYWRDPLRLAAGLQDDGTLSEAACQRALSSLRQIGEQVADLPATNVRTVGTAALRSARNIGTLLPLAEQALGHRIEILSGADEARLVFRGCTSILPDSSERRLVLDIGGASTELAIGAGREPRECNSWNVGAVRMTVQHFAGRRITEEAIAEARRHAAEVLAGAGKTFGRQNWDASWGSAGTVGTLCMMSAALGWNDGSSITPELLARAHSYLIEAGTPESPMLEMIKPDRRPVIAGGLAILEAVFDELQIDVIHPAMGALRIGLLHEIARQAV